MAEKKEFKEKIVAFVDILGFKGLVEAAESGTGKALPEILELLEELGRSKEIESIRMRGSSICPQSRCLEGDLEIQMTQISDCVIVSSEPSPLGALNVIFHCNKVVMALMRHGFMCRGYIIQGKVHHTSTQVVGSGYQKAYAKESQVSAFKTEADERGTPFVEVDAVVADLINLSEDSCVKKMYARMVKSDGDLVVIYPFQNVGHSFIINHKYSADKERSEVQKVREGLVWLKHNLKKYVDPNNVSATKKVNHYLRALDEQLECCSQVEKTIDALAKPIGAGLVRR